MCVLYTSIPMPYYVGWFYYMSTYIFCSTRFSWMLSVMVRLNKLYNTCKMHVKFEDGYKQRMKNISDNVQIEYI